MVKDKMLDNNINKNIQNFMILMIFKKIKEEHLVIKILINYNLVLYKIHYLIFK